MLLAVLRAEAAAARASAFAILSAEYARDVAGAKSRFKGAELIAALNAIRQHHLAAERALSSKLLLEARTRRRIVLAASRAKRKTQGKSFQVSAAAHGNRCHASESDLQERRQFRIRRRSPPKPRR
jgi:hypothetical protein